MSPKTSSIIITSGTIETWRHASALKRPYTLTFSATFLAWIEISPGLSCEAGRSQRATCRTAEPTIGTRTTAERSRSAACTAVASISAFAAITCARSVASSRASSSARRVTAWTFFSRRSPG
jgi:hypothetical protein